MPHCVNTASPSVIFCLFCKELLRGSLIKFIWKKIESTKTVGYTVCFLNSEHKIGHTSAYIIFFSYSA